MLDSFFGGVGFTAMLGSDRTQDYCSSMHVFLSVPALSPPHGKLLGS